MGNPSTNKGVRPKNQARSLQISTSTSESYSTNTSNAASRTDTNLIRLENIDLAVAKQAKLHEYVRIKLNGSIYEVFLNESRIGTIPAKYNEKLSFNKQHDGEIISIQLLENSATIYIKLL